MAKRKGRWAGWLLRCLGLALIGCGLASPATARWLQADTPNFRIYSDGSESQLRDMAATLEDYDRLLRLLTGLQEPPAPNKLEVYLVGGIGDLRVVSPRLSPDVRGFYSATPGQIAAFAIRRGEIGLDSQDVLLHEYAHHFMMQYYPNSYPAWYIEGFAEYMMTANFLPKTIEFGGVNAGRAASLLRGTWLPAQTVLEGDPDKLSAAQTGMFYAESWLMVHFIFRTGRVDALRQFIDARAAGQVPQLAFFKAFGMDYKQFDAELRRYMHGSISYSRFARAVDAAAPQVTVRALPPAADDLLLPRAAIRRGFGKEAGAALLGKVRKAAAAYPDDSFAQSVLADAEIAWGDNVRGMALLDGLIARAPNDVDLLYWRGRAAQRAARQDEPRREPLIREARTYFVRAFRLDPNHVPTLLAYAQTEPQRPPSENVMNILLKAHDLAPQVRTIAMRAAAGLMEQQRFDAAIFLLRPILTDPHAGGQVEAARRMMEVAQKHEKPAAIPTEEEDDGDDGG